MLSSLKYDFGLESVAFLAHVVSKDGIQVDLQKIEVVSEWPRMILVTEIQSFLGLADYYRRFMQDFSIIASPWTKLLRKNVKFVWTPEC